MKTEVEAAFAEMLDISKDIDKAVLFVPGEVLASNFAPITEASAVAQAQDLVVLGEDAGRGDGSCRSANWSSRRLRVSSSLLGRWSRRE